MVLQKDLQLPNTYQVESGKGEFGFKEQLLLTQGDLSD